MIELVIKNNIVQLSKSQEFYQDFVDEYLVKLEEVKKLDSCNFSKSHKKFVITQEERKLYTEDSKNIYFSAGILSMIPGEGSLYHIVNKSKSVVKTPLIDKERIKSSLSSFDLRDDQVTGVVKCLLCKRGVIQLPTATGKSAIITVVIKELLRNNPEIKVLILAPTLSTVDNINETLVENGVPAQVFGHPDNSLQSPVTTSLVQSLISHSKDAPSFLDPVNVVFYDECLPSNALILLPDGSTKKIKDIYEDESINEVMSYNIITNEYEIKKILKKYRTPFNDRFWKVYYESPVTMKLEGVVLTPNHRVFTRDRGYVQVSDLTQDDFIKVDFPFTRVLNPLLAATFIRVARITPNVGKIAEWKYNLEVEDNHNYFASSVLVSNCHHLKCETWNKLNTLLRNVEYSLGFSALSISHSEIYTKDIRDLSYQSALIVGSSGPVLLHMDPSYYIERGIIALPVIFRVQHQVKLPHGFDENSWNIIVKHGIMSDSRTSKIAQIATVFSKYNRKVLILVSEKEHAFSIIDALESLGERDVGMSFGGGQGYVYNSIDNLNQTKYKSIGSLDVLQQLSTGTLKIVIGTSHIDEGVDLKQLDCIILASGGKKDRRIIQRIGRVLRKSKTGKYAYIIDFTDTGSRVMSDHSKTRLCMYKTVIGISEKFIFDDIPVGEVEPKLRELENLI